MTEITKRRYKGVDIDSKRRKLTGDDGGLQRRNTLSIRRKIQGD